MLTTKYLNGIPEGSRVTKAASMKEEFLTKENIERIQGLNSIAEKRGQSLAQMALAWTLRKPQITTLLLGASSPIQIKENVAALSNLSFSDDELKEIDKYAISADINLWKASSTAG